MSPRPRAAVGASSRQGPSAPPPSSGPRLRPKRQLSASALGAAEGKCGFTAETAASATPTLFVRAGILARRETLGTDGLEVTYTLAGRKVSRNEFFRGIEGEIRRSAVAQVTDKVERVSCSKHGQGAKVSEVRETPDGFSLSVSGCCDDLVRRAQASLS